MAWPALTAGPLFIQEASDSPKTERQEATDTASLKTWKLEKRSFSDQAWRSEQRRQSQAPRLLQPVHV